MIFDQHPSFSFWSETEILYFSRNTQTKAVAKNLCILYQKLINAVYQPLFIKSLVCDRDFAKLQENWKMKNYPQSPPPVQLENAAGQAIVKIQRVCVSSTGGKHKTLKEYRERNQSEEIYCLYKMHLVSWPVQNSVLSVQYRTILST